MLPDTLRGQATTPRWETVSRAMWRMCFCTVWSIPCISLNIYEPEHIRKHAPHLKGREPSDGECWAADKHHPDLRGGGGTGDGIQSCGKWWNQPSLHDGTLTKTRDPHDGTLTKTRDPQCSNEPPWGHSWMCRKGRRPEDPKAQCISAFEHRSDLPDGARAGPPCSQCRGPGFHPRSGN